MTDHRPPVTAVAGQMQGGLSPATSCHRKNKYTEMVSENGWCVQKSVLCRQVAAVYDFFEEMLHPEEAWFGPYGEVMVCECVRYRQLTWVCDVDGNWKWQKHSDRSRMCVLSGRWSASITSCYSMVTDRPLSQGSVKSQRLKTPVFL